MAIFYALRCSHSWNLEELRKTADAKTETPKERIKRFFPQIFFFSPPRKRDFESETYGVSKSLIFIAPFSRLARYIPCLSGFVPGEALVWLTLVWLYKRTTDKASCFFGSNGLGAKREAIGLCAKVDFKFQNRTASSSHKHPQVIQTSPQSSEAQL